MSSPKRKSAIDPPSPPAKKLRSSPPPTFDPPVETTSSTTTDSHAAPDSHIDPARALAYWSATAPTVSGVLGGYPQVSRADLQGSRNFLAKLLRTPTSKSRNARPDDHQAKSQPQLPFQRAVDCGAGIGRVTQGLLVHFAERTDIVEPVTRFTDEIAGKPGVGRIFPVGLAEWTPDADAYDLVWNQWCVGQLTDAQLVAYLRRLPRALRPGGWIVVKENLSTAPHDVDVYDPVDSSVTRSDPNFRALFARANLKIVASELQRGLPKDLYPVRAYALQPM
nr:alpha N-terminal protein methyltransferase 1-like [Quercus suber]